jgi:sn-glycerol 3-phosphate transport system ATP-binding protein/multiple sugar transport system ATP-binding protein
MNLIEVELADGALRGPGGLALTPPAEALGDEIIYVVDGGGERDVRVRMPPTVHFAADAPVGLRHSGRTPPVYDATTEELVA